MAKATESHPAPTYVDDLVLVVLGLRAVAEALILIAIIEAWESWAGVYVNLAKSCCAAFDYGTNTRIPPCDVTYRGVPPPEQALHEPIRYLGTLLTLTHATSLRKTESDKRHKNVWRCWTERISSPHRSAKRWCSLQSSLCFGTRQIWYHGECQNWKNSRQCGFVGTAAHGGYLGQQTTPFSGQPRARRSTLPFGVERLDH